MTVSTGIALAASPTVSPESLLRDADAAMYWAKDGRGRAAVFADSMGPMPSASIDDFGTGFSSLSYLKRFPVDILKIDRSFVDGLGDDPDDSAIVGSITSLSTALDLTAVAEGVETALQMDNLLDLGCHQAQGYYFARPAPATDVESLLDRLAAEGLSASLLGSAMRS